MSENRFWNLLAKKLSGDATPQDIADLEQLMKENPEWIFSAEHIENLWKLQSRQASDYDAELAFELHINGLDKAGISFPQLHTPATEEELHPPAEDSSKKKWIRRGLLTGTFLLVIIFIWQFALKNNRSNLPLTAHFSEISTPADARTTKLVLPDSTVVWLNAGSRLTYDEQFGKTNRNTVLSGEAYFEVTHGVVPFIIKANDCRIKVLGTAFNVRSYPHEKTETSLIRGRVEITMDKRPGETFVLRPNEKLVVAEDIRQKEKETEPKVILRSLTRTPDQTIIETSWKDNRLIFQDESFEDVARKLEHWYNVDITIKNETINRQRLTGAFENENIKQALTALQIAYPFSFSMNGNKIEITP